MNDNKVTEWNEVDKLIPLKTLETLYLERNPIWNDPDEPHRGLFELILYLARAARFENFRVTKTCTSMTRVSDMT